MQSEEAFVRLQSMFASSNEQSTRNQLPGVVKSIVSDKVMSEVIIETSLGEIYSVITKLALLER
jgi:molybdopterin-binding protein